MGRDSLYQPRLQRFIGEDPIGFAGGDVNLYAYVLNNPTRFIDPLGLDWFRPPSEGYFAGRRDSRVEPGPGEIGGFIDDEVPAGHTFAIFHDAFVDMAVPVGMSWGLSYKSADYLFNIPSMPGMYIIAVEAELYNSLIKMRDKLRDKKRDRDGGLGRRK